MRLSLVCLLVFVYQYAPTSAQVGCVFPFKYLGKTYNKCTRVNSNRPWCATEAFYQGKYKYCDGPIDEPAITPLLPPNSNCQTYEGRTYYFINTRQDYYSARNFCKAYGLRLTRVYNNAHNAWLYRLSGANRSNKHWIGLSDAVKEGTFKWEDGAGLTYRAWARGEPNNAGNEDCTEYGHFPNGQWNDAACHHRFKFICESAHGTCPKTVYPQIPASMATCKNYNQRSYYFVTSRKNYQQAKTFCRKYKMTVVQVRDRNMDNWLIDAAKAKQGQRWWIGLTDVAKEGTFMWDNGRPLTYKNWYKGEPNNAGNEDCTEYGRYATGQWNDIDCGASRKFICESARPRC